MDKQQYAEKIIEAIRDNNSYPLAFVMSILDEIEGAASITGYNQALSDIDSIINNIYKEK